jgi:hypothetical protein
LKRKGFEKARARLLDAFHAHEDLKASKDWASFESAWTRLLTALNAVYSILEQSCRGAPTSERWFANAKKQRKTDEVLSYLHHARNVNDHGISEVLQQQPGGIGINASGGRGSPMYIERLAVRADGTIEELRGHSLDGSPLQITHYPARVGLVPVRDRGVDYEPPTSFLGEKLEDPSPVNVATQVLEFMVFLFSDAETLLAQD